jgi:hypothetical protein
MRREFHVPDCPVIAVIATKDRHFEVVPMTTSTLLVVVELALVVATISFLFKYFLRLL